MENMSEVKMGAGQSDGIEKVAAALVAAQGELTNPPKTKTVYAGQKKYSFAPLPEIIDAVRPVLTKHGLAVVQLVRERILETRLIHASGQWIGAAYTLPSLADSQAMGSAISYARRYCLCAMLGIAGEDDEDGAAATEAEQAEQEAKRKEAEKRLDALKGKGQVKSAYDGKVLAPGESALPGERGRKLEMAEGGNLRPESEGMTAGAASPSSALRAGVGPGAPSAEREKTAHSAGLHHETEKSCARSAGLHEEKGKTPSPPPSPLKGEGAGENPLAGIAKALAGLMKKEGITPGELKDYYVGKGHLPDTVEPTELPANYVSGLIKPENWKKAVAAIKGGK